MIAARRGRDSDVAPVPATPQVLASAQVRATPTITGATMHVTVNGEVRELQVGLSVAGLVVEFAAGRSLDAGQVAVERNRDVVPRCAYAETLLADGDQVEVVTFVGGG